MNDFPIPSKRVTGTISFLLTIGMIAFAYRYITGIVREADFGSVTLHWPYLLLTLVLFVTYYFIMSAHWLLSCRLIRSSIHFTQALSYFDSQPYKYMPTSVFTFSSRAVFARELGMTIKESSIAQMFENASMLIGNFGLFAVLYATRFGYGLSLLVAIGGAIILMFIFKLGTLHLRVKSRNLRIHADKLVIMFCVAAAGWLTVGLSFIMLNLALGMNVNFLDFLAANTLAFSLSLLAFFAPGGIGVRELVYTYFGVSGPSIVFWRIFTFVMDFILGLGAIVVTRSKPKKLFGNNP